MVGWCEFNYEVHGLRCGQVFGGERCVFKYDMPALPYGDVLGHHRRRFFGEVLGLRSGQVFIFLGGHFGSILFGMCTRNILRNGYCKFKRHVLQLSRGKLLNHYGFHVSYLVH